MNKNSAIAQLSRKVTAFGFLASVLLSISLLLIPSPALAHHLSGGKTPSTFASGFLAGLGHPVIGIDHLVFVIAIGLLAALSSKLGMVIPLTFILATAIGTGIHLESISLPIPEIIISASVLIVGIFLAKENKTNLALLIVVAAIAGLFHGYGYGESIFGARATALEAYLLGFCSIQLGISAIAFYVGKSILKKASGSPNLSLRFAGFAVCGAGVAFLSSAVLALIFPSV